MIFQSTIERSACGTPRKEVKGKKNWWYISRSKSIYSVIKAQGILISPFGVKFPGGHEFTYFLLYFKFIIQLWLGDYEIFFASLETNTNSITNSEKLNEWRFNFGSQFNSSSFTGWDGAGVAAFSVTCEVMNFKVMKLKCSREGGWSAGERPVEDHHVSHTLTWQSRCEVWSDVCVCVKISIPMCTESIWGWNFFLPNLLRIFFRDFPRIWEEFERKLISPFSFYIFQIVEKRVIIWHAKLRAALT